MRETDIPLVKDLPLFKDMQDTHFDALMRGGYVQNFPPHVELITEGDPADFLHIVTEGSVELFAGWNGRETTMATVEPHATFILAASVKDAPYLMSARTLEKSRLILLPSADVRTAFERDSAFARAVVTELAQCYRSVVKNTKGLKLRSSIERLANYLLRCQERTGGAKSFELQIEKRRLASYLGMTPENLSRAIKSLQPYSVRIDGTQVTISDSDDLASLAKPSPLIDGRDADSTSA
ncbi:MAG: cyclic nucleotide-binding domain-containing protein [Alphaproteobacteria bacterium]|nr:cyclic nucleotide-binding domain-containing protein [Alphaproteobacteria bacterium]MBO6628364.1 cyclic nucleotide-binding domain-containing protein [Alphaproteobacteria bacterium]MDF1624751.1 cyclic nucleotide-binding domain-containing protein [Parvibaculaceae bacterium]